MISRAWPRGAVALALAMAVPARASAQACCAGASAVTPARLELHERALVGVELRGAWGLGSYTPAGRFVASPPRDAEVDLEQDVFGAVRFLGRGQGALLVPFLETYRREDEGAGIGGGVGDVNVSARYDFIVAGQSRFLPGIAVLAGITAPTGRPPESATPPLNLDATGTGAWQISGALALEQTFGAWLVNATAIVAERTPRFGQTLAAQGTLLAAGAYMFPNDVSVALSAAYTFEGDARAAGDAGGARDVPGSSRRLTRITLSVLWPISDTLRLVGGVALDPPIQDVGRNQPSTVGATATVVRAWF